MPTFRPEFRPDTYWDETLQRIAAVKGTLRQNVLIEELRTGVAAQMPDLLRAPSLPAGILAMLQATDPAQLSGEFLPDPLPGEVEIARVYRTRAPTGGVCSVRALKTDAGIRYSVVDDTGGTYALESGSSDAPLSLRALARLIDTARCVASPETDEPLLRGNGLLLGEAAYRLAHINPAPLDLLDSLAAASVFYPELEDWYEHALVKWIRLAQKETRPPNDSEAVLKMPL